MRVEDALAAARLGADAIGLVFHRSSFRCVTAGQAWGILRALPPFVTPVGLFVDASAEEVRDTAGSLGLRHVQLHGGEDADCVRKLEGLIVIKAVRVASETFQAELAAWREAIARYHLANLRGLVLETPAVAPGGTGMPNDFAFVKACQDAGMMDGLPPIIAAGGLTPGNVANVIRDLRPWAVDVSSGVESSRGIKSPEKIEAFIAAASSRAASHG